MLYTHTIGRIGKDCQVITGTHGTFMAVDIAVDDYSKGQNITTWVRVRSSRENHVRLAEYLTKGRLILVEELSQHRCGQTAKARATHKSPSMRTASLSSMQGRKRSRTTTRRRLPRKELRRRTRPSHRRTLQHLTRRTCHSNEERRMQ